MGISTMVLAGFGVGRIAAGIQISSLGTMSIREAT